MADPRIIASSRELDRVGLKMTEAVNDQPSGLEGLSDLEKAQFLAQLPRALQALRDAEKNPAVMSTPQHQFASLLQSAVAANATSSEVLSTGELEAKFDTSDWLGWAKTVWHMLKDARNKFTWQDPPAGAETVSQFGAAVTIAVFSDWGTGLYGAPHITQQIEQAKSVDIVLHLGDVYYSGTAGEFKDRFTKFWPKRPESLHRALNGNHEMYSGGRPYWSAIQQAPFNQKSPCFAYENDHWVILGLDTAYQDFDLLEKNGHNETAWLISVVEKAVKDGKRVVFFSHHQPYSLLDHQGPNLKAKLGNQLLEPGKVFAWYWGHEHECVIYDRDPDWRMYGRCVGHAGMPEFRKIDLDPVNKPQFRRIGGARKDGKTIPGALVLDGPNEFIKGEEKKFTPHGFVRLRFENDRLFETYLSPDGSELISERELAK
jgi:Calcineurin-like phosphoesterase